MSRPRRLRRAQLALALLLAVACALPAAAAAQDPDPPGLDTLKPTSGMGVASYLSGDESWSEHTVVFSEFAPARIQPGEPFEYRFSVHWSTTPAASVVQCGDPIDEEPRKFFWRVTPGSVWITDDNPVYQGPNLDFTDSVEYTIECNGEQGWIVRGVLQVAGAETAGLSPGCFQDGDQFLLPSPYVFSFPGSDGNLGTVATLQVGDPGRDCTPSVCDDELDADGDGLAGYPADPGCVSLVDRSEDEPGLICDDGLDNDGDGRADWPADDGCEGLLDSYEAPAPVAAFEIAYTKRLNRIEFHPTGSSALPRSTYTWSFGDGDTWVGNAASHRYPRSRAYTATLTITQPDGQSATAARTVAVPTWVIAETVCGKVKSGKYKGRERCYLLLSNEYAAALKRGGKMLLNGQVVDIGTVLDRFLGAALRDGGETGAKALSVWLLTRFVGKKIFGDFYKLNVALLSTKWASEVIKLRSLVALYNQIGDPAAANQWCVNTRLTYRGTKKPPKFEVTWPNSFVRNYKHGVSKLGLDAYQAEWYQGAKARKLPTECTGLMGMAWHEKGLRDARKLLRDPRVRVLRAGAWDAPDARVLE